MHWNSAAITKIKIHFDYKILDSKIFPRFGCTWEIDVPDTPWAKQKKVPAPWRTQDKIREDGSHLTFLLSQRKLRVCVLVGVSHTAQRATEDINFFEWLPRVPLLCESTWIKCGLHFILHRSIKYACTAPLWILVGRRRAPPPRVLRLMKLSNGRKWGLNKRRRSPSEISRATKGRCFRRTLYFRAKRTGQPAWQEFFGQHPDVRTSTFYSIHNVFPFLCVRQLGPF